MGAGGFTPQPPLPPGPRQPPRPRPVAPPPPRQPPRPRPVAPPPPPQRPLPINQGGKPIFAPLPPTQPRPPIDMVRDPNYDIVMAQRNYENNLAQSIANSQLQNTPPPPPTDPARLAEYNAFMANQNSQTQPNNFTKGRLMGAPTNEMQIYNNLLQQGMQRNNAMNQNAASNFANMQAGAPTTQPAIPATTMPMAGLGAQKPKSPTPKPTQSFPNIRAF